MLGRQGHSRAGFTATALACFWFAACGFTQMQPTPAPNSTTTNPIDLNNLNCPSGTVKAIINVIRVTIGRPNDLNADEIVCLAQETGKDVILQINTRYHHAQRPPNLFMVGPDSAGSLAQLQASSASSGGFTPVGGVGDAAASFVENVSGRRALTLYVQRGGTEFHISMETALPDAVVEGYEKTVALALLPLLPSTPVHSAASVNPLDVSAFYAGDYAASLLKVDEITAALGRPVLPLSANGGKPSYQPGIDISNATTVTKDGSLFFDLQVYRAGSASAAKTFLATFFEVPTTTPNPQVAGLGDGAFLDVPGVRLLVLSGREIASISVHGTTVSGTDALAMEKALALAVVPRLLH